MPGGLLLFDVVQWLPANEGPPLSPLARGACQAHTGLREIDEADLKPLGVGKMLVVKAAIKGLPAMVSHDEPMIRAVANLPLLPCAGYCWRW